MVNNMFIRSSPSYVKKCKLKYIFIFACTLLILPDTYSMNFQEASLYTCSFDDKEIQAAINSATKNTPNGGTDVTIRDKIVECQNIIKGNKFLKESVSYCQQEKKKFLNSNRITLTDGGKSSVSKITINTTIDEFNKCLNYFKNKRVSPERFLLCANRKVNCFIYSDNTSIHKKLFPYLNLISDDDKENYEKFFDIVDGSNFQDEALNFCFESTYENKDTNFFITCLYKISNRKYPIKQLTNCAKEKNTVSKLNCISKSPSSNLDTNDECYNKAKPVTGENSSTDETKIIDNMFSNQGTENIPKNTSASETQTTPITSKAKRK